MRARTVGAFMADEYPRVVEPVVVALLEADDLDIADVAVVDWAGAVLTAGAPLADALLRFRDADGTGIAVQLDVDESDAAFAERLRSDLRDFVAESTFGWGQLRG